jgi:hypothetical protein
MRDTYVNRRSQYNCLNACFINGRLSIKIPADGYFIPTFFLVLSTFPKGIPEINSKSCQLHFEQILWHFLFDATLDGTVRRGGTALDLYSDTSANDDNSFGITFVSRNVISHRLSGVSLLAVSNVNNPVGLVGLPYVMWSAHLFVTYIQMEKISSWNGPTVHVCCFMLARASTKTFVSRIHIR